MTIAVAVANHLLAGKMKKFARAKKKHDHAFAAMAAAVAAKIKKLLKIVIFFSCGKQAQAWSVYYVSLEKQQF